MYALQSEDIWSTLYLSKYIPKGSHSYNNRLNEGGLKTYHCRTDVFTDLFFHILFLNGTN